jgi:hypothetical protein
MIQSPPSSDPVAVVERFNEAFNRHDVDGIMAAMTDSGVHQRPVSKPKRSLVPETAAWCDGSIAGFEMASPATFAEWTCSGSGTGSWPRSFRM